MPPKDAGKGPERGNQPAGNPRDDAAARASRPGRPQSAREPDELRRQAEERRQRNREHFAPARGEHLTDEERIRLGLGPLGRSRPIEAGAAVPATSSETEDDKARKATLIAYVLNLLNGRTGVAATTPQYIMDIDPFSATQIVKDFLAKKWRIGPSTAKRIQDIMQDPSCVGKFRLIDPLQVSAVAGEDDKEPVHVEEENIGIGDSSEYQGPEHSDRSRHPTGQHPSDYEQFFQDEDGNWFVKFRKQISGGSVYEQIDPLPTWVPDVPPFDKDNGIRSYIEPMQDKSQIPPFWTSDKATWKPIEGKTYEWYRSPVPKQPEKRFARPKFILRGYDRNNHQMLRQYLYGSNWKDFDRHLREFDINDKKSAEEYNRWSRQVTERNHHAYTKRPTREPWKPYEMEALRRYFNELIQTEGLAKFYFKPNFNKALEKVNEARQARDPKGPRPAPRDKNAIKKQAVGDEYPADVDRLGIQEWRAFGQTIVEFRDQYPDARIPERFLKPKHAIPMDDVDQIANPKKRKAADAERQQSVASTNGGPKLDIVLKDGKAHIFDRADFNGRLMSTVFGVENEAEDDKEESATEEVAGDDQVDQAERKDENDPDDDDDNTSEPQQKRRKIT